MKVCIKIVAALWLSVSCMFIEACSRYEEFEPVRQMESESGVAEIKLCLDAPITRSKIMVSPDKINEYMAAVYCDSLLVTTGYCNTETDARLSFSLVTGKRYNFYVMANVGEVEFPIHERGVDDILYLISTSESPNDAGFPMSGSTENVLIDGSTASVDIMLERLFARIMFTVEKQVDDLEITSVRLRQCPIKMYPFLPSGSNRVTKAREVCNYDRATDVDLRMLNRSGQVFFYVLENCQGTLLPQNTNPWAKVPDAIGDKASLCTYLEVNCTFSYSEDYEGSVMYRVYLGKDNCKNFDIERNTYLDVVMVMTEKGVSFETSNWKLSSSVVYLGGVTGAWSGNPHSSDNFYVTEKVRFKYEMNETAFNYWSSRGFDIVGVDENGEEIIDFGESVGSDGSYYAIGTCLKSGTVDVWLTDTDGNRVICLDEGAVIKTPRVAVTCAATRYDKSVVIPETDVASFYINGVSDKLYLYLTDDNGYNLNLMDGYGCDPLMCSWTVEVDDLSEDFNTDCIKLQSVSYGDSADDGLVAVLEVSVINDGTDAYNNEKLTAMLGEELLNLKVEDKELGISGGIAGDLEAYLIEVGVVGVTSMTSSLGSSIVYRVRNSSMLPLSIGGWQLNSCDFNGNALAYNSALESTSGMYSINTMLFPDTFWTNEEPLYISKMPDVCCSFESMSGIPYIQDGEDFYFAADDSGVSAGNAANVIAADRRIVGNSNQYRRQLSLFHLLNADFVYPDTYESRFEVYDELQNSTSNTIIYGNDGYKSCGVYLYYAHGGHYCSNMYSYGTAYTDFTGYEPLLKYQALDNLNSKTVDVKISFDENYRLVATASENISLTFKVSGVLNSHIRTLQGTDAFFGIGNKATYYTNAYNFSSSMTEVSLSSSPTVIDGEAVKSALEAIRTIEYYSKWDGITQREVLKPTGMTLSIDVGTVDPVMVMIEFPTSLTYTYNNINYGTHEPPSTYDSTLSNTPTGSTFADGDVTMNFTVEHNMNRELNMITAK